MRIAWVGSATIAAAIAALALSGCGKSATPPPPPIEVGVITAHLQSVVVETELPGRANPYAVSNVEPQVSGIIKARLFVEGSIVKAGQPLYQIDPRPYQAALDQAKGQLAKDQASLAGAQIDLQRYQTLMAANAVAKQTLDDQAALVATDEGIVQSDKANVEAAQINLDYTKISAPIPGLIGASSVTAGALVTANQTTALATIQQTDPIYVDVTESTVDLLRLRHELATGQLQSAGPNEAKVQLTLEDGSAYPLEGKLEFTDITVDQSTGSVILRAIFQNPNQVLLPGMFVHEHLAEGVNQNAILVPEAGVTHDAKGMPTTLIVDTDNKVALRSLTASQTRGANWVVEGGLKPGDKVIVSGVQKVQPGMVVKPVEQPMPATSSAAQ